MGSLQLRCRDTKGCTQDQAVATKRTRTKTWAYRIFYTALLFRTPDSRLYHVLINCLKTGKTYAGVWGLLSQKALCTLVKGIEVDVGQIQWNERDTQTSGVTSFSLYKDLFLPGPRQGKIATKAGITCMCVSDSSNYITSIASFNSVCKVSCTFNRWGEGLRNLLKFTKCQTLDLNPSLQSVKALFRVSQAFPTGWAQHCIRLTAPLHGVWLALYCILHSSHYTE